MIDPISNVPAENPYRYVHGPADVVSLTERAGLDADKYANKDFLFSRGGIGALWELLSDGEVQIATSTSEAGKSPEERHGEFYEGFAALRAEAEADTDPELTDQFNRLARFAGHQLYQSVIGGSTRLPRGGGTSAAPYRVTRGYGIRFDDYNWQKTVKIDDATRVLEYGPGIFGTRYIDVQLETLLIDGVIPNAQLFLISNGPFVNQYLMDYAREPVEMAISPQSGDIFLQRYTTGREDGMVRATDAMLDMPIQFEDHRVMDAILFCGLNKAAKPDLKYTIGQSTKLLNEGGKLFVAATVDEVVPGAATYDEYLGWAKDAGYNLKWQATRLTGSASTHSQAVSGLAVLGE